MLTRRLQLLIGLTLAFAALVAVARPACGVTIGDVTRVEGQRINKLIGHGLVIGLNGTGDGGEFLPAIRPLATMLQKFSNPILSVKELADAKNIALVMVSATIPESGVRMGDRLDVHVSAIGSSKSLKGGRLLLMPMQGPQEDSIVYAMAEGSLRIEDATVPTQGLVDGGAVLEEEVVTEYVENNKFRLVLQNGHAGFSMASQVATVINQDNFHRVGHNIAAALDARTIEIEVPEADRKNPVSFIGDVQELYLLLPHRKARVKINQHAGTIAITGNVEISPTVVSHGNLVVKTQPAPVVTSGTPELTTTAAAAAPTEFAGGTGPFFKVDPQSEGGAKLQDLVAALNVLNVPATDRIHIVKLLSAAGQIHAEVTFED